MLGFQLINVSERRHWDSPIQQHAPYFTPEKKPSPASRNLTITAFYYITWLSI